MTSPLSTSSPLRLRVWGERACFTRPEMKVERVSYHVMTPSAARGVLEAIIWRPEIRWRVERIDVLKPIRWDAVRRNEVSHRVPIGNLVTVMNGGSALLGLDIEKARQQRAARILRDVDYLIHARIELTAKAGPDDPLVKYVEMFCRRVQAGQCFHRPYLGTREFAADFALIADGAPTPTPIADSLDLGWMLFDIDYSGSAPMALFFSAQLEHGSLTVPAPESEEVRR